MRLAAKGGVSAMLTPLDKETHSTASREISCVMIIWTKFSLFRLQTGTRVRTGKSRRLSRGDLPFRCNIKKL